jgi:hypothetical protein
MAVFVAMSAALLAGIGLTAAACHVVLRVLPDREH